MLAVPTCWPFLPLIDFQIKDIPHDILQPIWYRVKVGGYLSYEHLLNPTYNTFLNYNSYNNYPIDPI